MFEFKIDTEIIGRSKYDYEILRNGKIIGASVVKAYFNIFHEYQQKHNNYEIHYEHVYYELDYMCTV